MSTPNNSKTVAVLLMAYGSPEKLEDVAAYFTDIRGGVRPEQKMIDVLEQRYRMVGGKTPLVEITNKQAEALQNLLDQRHGKGAYKVYVGMKHWHPYIKDVLKEIADQGIAEVVAIALAPHYSKMSIGGYHKAIEQANQPLNVKFIESWHTNPHLIECIVRQINAVLNKFQQKPHLVFTAHSLPQRIREWNDPYEQQLLETSGLIAEHFPDLSWSFSFQSAGHTHEPWIGPDILDNLAELKSQGKRDILICSVGFVADNLEIIYDLDIEAQNKAKELGIHLERAPMRNTEQLFIEALYNLIRA